MSNKRITDLTELTTPTTDDVFPIVDIATNTTQKVQVGNLPIQTAVTTALATKQDTLVSGTNIKTVNSTSLVGSGNVAVQPTLVSGTSIKTVNSTSLLGAGDVAVQPTLVSGTNIKTLNSVSLLGSGDIVLAATPSGVAGAIQFSNGSAFASDAPNLFWDDTNNRLGVGTNAPTAILQAQNATNGVLLARFKDAVASTSYIDIKNDATLNEYTGLYWGTEYRILSKAGNPMIFNCSNVINFADGYATKMVVTPSEVQIGSISGARLGIKGSGSTSATTSLLVQNSSGTELLKVADNGEITTYDINARVIYARANTLELRPNASGGAGSASLQGFVSGLGWLSMFTAESGKDFGQIPRGAVVNGTTINASAIFQVDSTTKGFLPPRMTTTEKNAIASPVAGLVVYDTTTNKLCCYNGSTWNDLF